MPAEPVRRPGRTHARRTHARRVHVRLGPARLGPARLAGCAVVLACLAALAVAPAHGGFTAAVADPAGSGQSGDLLLAASASGTNECSQASSGAATPIGAANSATCTGTLLPSGSLPPSGSLSSSATVSDSGSLPGSATTLRGGACGAAYLANTATPSDPLLVRNQIRFGQPGPIAGSAAIGLTGAGGPAGAPYAASAVAENKTSSGAFSEAVWFDTSATAGGTLLGFASTPTDTGAAEWDRMLWVDPAGHVVFAVYPGATQELVSPSSYADGSWHLAVATLSPVAGTALYVDGRLVASDSSVTAAQAYTGYWHAGWDNEAQGWPDAPTDPFFDGSLSDAAVFGSALSAAQVSALAAAGSQPTWASTVTADGATESWSLGDTFGAAWAGAVPGLSGNPCGSVQVTVSSGGGTTCTGGGAGLANSLAPSDPMCAAGPDRYSQPGPPALAGSAGLGLTGGVGGYAAGALQGPAPSGGFSEAVWFETTASGGGTLLGFASTPTDTGAAEWDRMLWVDPAGHVVFGVYPGATKEIASTGSYADGSWHLAVATLSPTAGTALYVDGSLVASDPTTTSAQAGYNGYWHAGWDNETSAWPDPPTDAYFNGTLSDAAVLPSALSAAQVTALYSSGSQAAWSSALAADGATESWSLGQAPGAVTTTLASLASTPAEFAAGPAPGAPAAYSLTLAASGAAASAPAAGLVLTLPLTLEVADGRFSSSLVWPSEDVVL